MQLYARFWGYLCKNAVRVRCASGCVAARLLVPGAGLGFSWRVWRVWSGMGAGVVLGLMGAGGQWHRDSGRVKNWVKGWGRADFWIFPGRYPFWHDGTWGRWQGAGRCGRWRRVRSAYLRCTRSAAGAKRDAKRGATGRTRTPGAATTAGRN